MECDGRSDLRNRIGWSRRVGVRSLRFQGTLPGPREVFRALRGTRAHAPELPPTILLPPCFQGRKSLVEAGSTRNERSCGTGGLKFVGAAGFEPTTSCSQIRPTPSQPFAAIRKPLQTLEFLTSAQSSRPTNLQDFAAILLPPCFHHPVPRKAQAQARSCDPFRGQVTTCSP